MTQWDRSKGSDESKGRMMRKALIGFVALGLAALAPAAPATPDDVLSLHGVQDFEKVAELRFSFVVTRGGEESARHWQWEPATGRVRLEEDGVVTEYNRFAMTDDPATTTADKKWINDTFWAYWPIHARWATDATITIEAPAANPLSGAEQPRLVIAYPPDGGGYTPGDRYELYLGEDGLPTAWTFHRGGAEEPSLACTFERYVTAGPLVLASDHQTTGGGFRLEIRDVAVRLAGSDELLAATPAE